MIKILEAKNYYSWQSNSYLLYDENKNAVVFDPTNLNNGIEDFIKQNNLKLKAIILTHGHFDHITGLDKYKKEFKCDVLIHQNDIELMHDPRLNSAETFGLHNFSKVNPDVILKDQMVLSYLSEPIFVIHTPFHTQGSCVFYLKTSKILITGDSLFQNGYGRCDLYGGDQNQIESSLNRILSLPDDVICYPGHGENTTIKQEKQSFIY